MPKRRPVNYEFTVTDDKAMGKLIVENGIKRVVFGYVPSPLEFSNRGGSAIYGLFDKPSDPQCMKNIAQLIDYGSGSSTPSHAGIGGLGSTKAHASLLQPTVKTAATSECGSKGRLLNKEMNVDTDGIAHLSAMYDVGGFYTIDKGWRVYPRDGAIELDATYTVAQDCWLNDPNMNFAVSCDSVDKSGPGFTRVGWFGHDWTPTMCGWPWLGWENGANRWVEKVVSPTDPDADIGTKHVQMYRCDGAPMPAQGSPPILLIEIEPDGIGYEGSGLFKLGYDQWKSVQQITGEFSNYRTAAHALELRWSAWYANDGGASRFKPFTAGTTWTDHYLIDITH